MGYKWKPNATQKREYHEKMLQRESLNVCTTTHAIREGCWVKFFSTNKGKILEGYVINSSYGDIKNQHTFTIDCDGVKLMVKGRNLYPNILEHIQGDESKKINK
jgi:hypothetical protein